MCQFTSWLTEHFVYFYKAKAAVNKAKEKTNKRQRTAPRYFWCSKA